MKRRYTQTELWMGYGVVAGGLVGTMLLIVTGDPIWVVLLGFGLVVGLIIGQLRDDRSS